MNASLQKLLSVVKNLLLVSHIPLLSVFVPAITLGFFEIIFKALRFDFLEVSEYTQAMFGISEKEANKAEFDDTLTSEAELERKQISPTRLRKWIYAYQFGHSSLYNFGIDINHYSTGGILVFLLQL